MNILFYFVIKLLSFLPFSVLKVIGFSIGFLFRLSGYRHSVILKNLTLSFPQKSADEISRLTKQYYAYLGRLVAESIKLFHISKQNIQERISFTNDHLIKAFLKENKDVVVVLGHYGNWELALLASSLNFDAEMIGIYKPLSSSFWNKKLFDVRSQYGAKLLSMKKSLRYLLKNKNRGNLIGIIADQTPSADEINHSITFLNQKTAVFLGTEKLAKKLQCPVFYASVSPKTFGYYNIKFELISKFPNNDKDGELTSLHCKKLENQINTNPPYWLWSHRRWKHLR